MANQGQQGDQGRPGDRQHEGNLGRAPARPSTTPAGTSGRQNGDAQRRPREDDEESGLGNRTTNR